jgi:addiction module HigA family antidote
MQPKNRVPTHPGEILKEEFLSPLGLTQQSLADRLKIPLQRVNEVCTGKRGVSVKTAWLLAQAFDTSPEFWMNLQSQHDLAKHRPKERVVTFRTAPKVERFDSSAVAAARKCRR